MQGHIDVCAMLVEGGANMTARDRWGRTPLAIAQQGGSRDDGLVHVLSKATKARA
jgi:hypothetical protein